MAFVVQSFYIKFPVANFLVVSDERSLIMDVGHVLKPRRAGGEESTETGDWCGRSPSGGRVVILGVDAAE